MKLEIAIGREQLMFFAIFLVALAFMGLVAAYGGSQPSVMGHSAGELDLAPLYISGGNVGIGTATPAAKLDVVGDLRVSGTQQPNYDSGWVACDSITTHVQSFSHGLGVIPLRFEAYVSKDNPPTKVWRMPTETYASSWAPEHWVMNTTSINAHFFSGDLLIYGEYVNGAWSGGVDSGYCRVLSWK